jgi:molybdate transport system substrate-binding protein
MVAAAAALLLTGCASVGSEPPPEDLRGTLTVFAAASLAESFDAIATDFEAEHPGLDVVINYGGSSALATQIVEGAPADVFAAASTSTMQTVVNAELTAHPADFATNTLQLAVPPGNPGGVDGLLDLARPELSIALCAVEVPCGAVAHKLLERAGVVPSVDTWEQDVKAVLAKIELDEVDVGLVYRTDVRAAGMAVEGLEAERADGVVATYPIATLVGSLNPLAGAAFMQWVLTSGQPVLAKAGFGAP